jgi:uncharacterized protein (TIGR03435 family)
LTWRSLRRILFLYMNSMRPTLTIVVSMVLLMVAASALFIPLPDLPRFENVSIRPDASADPLIGEGFEYPGGFFTENNVTLADLIVFAYRTPAFRIVGGPGWIWHDRYDIIAKVGGDAEDYSSPEQRGKWNRLSLMMRALLAERFHLAVHRGNRKRPVYALTMARSDGKAGPQLSRVAVNCALLMRQPADLLKVSPQRDKPLCGTWMSRGRIASGGVSLWRLAGAMSMSMHRDVLNRTGLTGTFDFELRWPPEEQFQQPGPGPSIFTAVQEQLGLKLEAASSLINVLVVDSASQPTRDESAAKSLSGGVRP